MNNNQSFDFSVDKEKNTIVIKRVFDADRKLVWQAWTTAELLDQWWGPAPCTAKTKSLEFVEGGHWLYCMIVPPSITDDQTEQRHWGKQEFEKIVPHTFFSGTDVFCDEHGNADPNLPKGKFRNEFSDEPDGKTIVTMISNHDSLDEIEQIIAMGFKEGIKVCLDQLEILLAK